MTMQMPLQIRGEMRVYTVPDGLGELMSDISKEVLRVQPKNIYYFISEYLITLLRVREAVKTAVPVVDEALEEAKKIQDFYKKIGVTPQQANRAATIIQAAYRGYSVRKKVRNLLGIVRQRQYEEEQETSKSDTESVLSRESFFNSLRARGITKNMTIQAATKIQAFFRGYYARLKMSKEGLECYLNQIPSHESWRHDWMDEFKKEEELSKKSGSTNSDFKQAVAKSVEGDRLKLTSLFHGSYEDYTLRLSCEDLLKTEEEKVITPSTTKEDIYSSDHFFPETRSASVKSETSAKMIVPEIMKDILEKALSPRGETTDSIKSFVSQDSIMTIGDEEKGSMHSTVSIYKGTVAHNEAALEGSLHQDSRLSMKRSGEVLNKRSSLQDELRQSIREGSLKSLKEGSLRSLKEGSLKSLREASIKSLREGSVIKSLQEESGVKSVLEGSVKSVRTSSVEEGSVKSLRGGSLTTKSLREGSLTTKSLREGSVKSLREGSVKSLREGSVKSLQEGSVKSHREGSVKSLKEGSVRSLPEVSIKPLAQEGSKKSLIPDDAVKSLHSIGSKKSGQRGSQKSLDRKSSGGSKSQKSVKE